MRYDAPRLGVLAFKIPGQQSFFLIMDDNNNANTSNQLFPIRLWSGVCETC